MIQRVLSNVRGYGCMLNGVKRACTLSRTICRPYSSQSLKSQRVARLNSRLPRFLSRYTVPLMNAPITHVTSFLILHEITAILPLFGLAAVFHYYNWLPPYISEWKWVSDGVEKFGQYFRRKGWLGDDDALRNRWWGRSEGGMRLVVEFASAYAITKAMLPLRLVLSVWATPWFARLAVRPVTNIFYRIFQRKGNIKSSIAGSKSRIAAGTGATGGGVISQKTLPK